MKNEIKKLLSAHNKYEYVNMYGNDWKTNERKTERQMTNEYLTGENNWITKYFSVLRECT